MRTFVKKKSDSSIKDTIYIYENDDYKVVLDGKWVEISKNGKTVYSGNTTARNGREAFELAKKQNLIDSEDEEIRKLAKEIGVSEKVLRNYMNFEGLTLKEVYDIYEKVGFDPAKMTKMYDSENSKISDLKVDKNKIEQIISSREFNFVKENGNVQTYKFIGQNPYDKEYHFKELTKSIPENVGLELSGDILTVSFRDSSNIVDATPITVERAIYVDGEAILEYTYNGRKMYLVTSNYRNEKVYTGGGSVEYSLEEAIKTAKDFVLMHRLQKKYGEVEGNKRYLAGYRDSKELKDDALLKKYQEKVDYAIKTFGRIGGGLYDELDDNHLYVDQNNKVQYQVKHDEGIKDISSAVSTYKEAVDKLANWNYKDNFDLIIPGGKFIRIQVNKSTSPWEYTAWTSKLEKKTFTKPEQASNYISLKGLDNLFKDSNIDSSIKDETTTKTVDLGSYYRYDSLVMKKANDYNLKLDGNGNKVKISGDLDRIKDFVDYINEYHKAGAKILDSSITDSDISLLKEYYNERQPSRKMELRSRLKQMGLKEGVSGVNSRELMWVELNGKRYEVKNLSSVKSLDSVQDLNVNKSSSFRIIKKFSNGYGIAQTYGDGLFYVIDKNGEVIDYPSYAFLTSAEEAAKRMKDSAIKDYSVKHKGKQYIVRATSEKDAALKVANKVKDSWFGFNLNDIVEYNGKKYKVEGLYEDRERLAIHPNINGTGVDNIKDIKNMLYVEPNKLKKVS